MNLTIIFCLFGTVIADVAIGTASGPPNAHDSTGSGASIDAVQICASSERQGISDKTGAPADYVKLKDVGQEVAKLNAPTVYLYLCKTNAAERNGEALVDKVVFTIDSSPTGAPGTFRPLPAYIKIENYSPFEYSSTNQFGGAGVKKIHAKLLDFSGVSKTITKLLDLTSLDLGRIGNRWRFRRHLHQASNPPPAGTGSGPPGEGNGGGDASIDTVQICASSESQGIDKTGAPADYVKLKDVGQEVAKLNAPTVYLYLCKTNAAERNGEALVDKVVFTIDSSPTGAPGTFRPLPAYIKIENYSPFEYSSTNQFGGAGVKKIHAKLLDFSGVSKTITKLLDLTSLDLGRIGNRWRFRRHLHQASNPPPAGNR